MVHDTLSATDRAFLAIEEGAMAMHVGALMLFEGGSLVRGGALDMERMHKLVESGLDGAPRLRQRVREVPGLGAVWVDDERFRLDAHLFHTAIPRPGGQEQLLRLAGRLFAQPLDRRRPLWEMWFVEGLEGGRFALVMKAHHAMIDGVGGMEMLASLLRPEPREEADEAKPWQPRPAPGAMELATERARGALAAAQQLRASLSHGDATARAKELASGLMETLREGLSPADATSLNPAEVGPHRSFGALRLDLARVKRLRQALGGTLNDLALTAVAGGLRAYLLRRGEPVDQLKNFRAMVPVNMRTRQGDPASEGGNHVSLVLARLPVALADPLERLAEVRRVCEHLKHESHEIEGAAFIERLSDVGGPNVVAATFRVAMKLRAFNVVVSNVPGPPFPFFLGPSRMTALWGLVPLFAHQALAVSLLSYDGGLFIGLHADPDAVADVSIVGDDIERAFDELEQAARGTTLEPS